MDVRVAPELARILTDLAATSGRATDDLVADALVGYLDELASLRDRLDARYDDLKDGRVESIDGEEAKQRLRAKSGRVPVRHDRLRVPPRRVS